MLISLGLTGCADEVPVRRPDSRASVATGAIVANFSIKAGGGVFHVVFADRDDFQLKIGVVEPGQPVADVSTVDRVDTYPGLNPFLGAHAYAVLDGTQHLIYWDQEDPETLLAKWVYRAAEGDSWWVDTLALVGAPRALFAGAENQVPLAFSGDPLLRLGPLASGQPGDPVQPEVTVTASEPADRFDCTANGSGLSGIVVHDGSTGELAVVAVDGTRIAIVAGASAAFSAACVPDGLLLAWFAPTRGEIRWQLLGPDGSPLGDESAVTPAQGVTGVHAYWTPQGPVFVFDEYDPRQRQDGLSRIFPGELNGGSAGYRKESLLRWGSPPAVFQAAHDDQLLAVAYLTGRSLSAALFSLWP